MLPTALKLIIYLKDAILTFFLIYSNNSTSHRMQYKLECGRQNHTSFTLFHLLPQKENWLLIFQMIFTKHGVSEIDSLYEMYLM